MTEFSGVVIVESEFVPRSETPEHGPLANQAGSLWKNPALGISARELEHGRGFYFPLLKGGPLD